MAILGAGYIWSKSKNVLKFPAEGGKPETRVLSLPNAAVDSKEGRECPRHYTNPPQLINSPTGLLIGHWSYLGVLSIGGVYTIQALSPRWLLFPSCGLARDAIFRNAAPPTTSVVPRTSWLLTVGHPTVKLFTKPRHMYVTK